MPMSELCYTSGDTFSIYFQRIIFWFMTILTKKMKLNRNVLLFFFKYPLLLDEHFCLHYHMHKLHQPVITLLQMRSSELAILLLGVSIPWASLCYSQLDLTTRFVLKAQLMCFKCLMSTIAMLLPHLDTSWVLYEMPEPLQIQVSLKY